MADDSPKTTFGNGWSEYRRLFLMYMEEEKDWRLRTEKRMARLEQARAVQDAQDPSTTLETLIQNSNHFGTALKLLGERFDKIEKERAEEKKQVREDMRLSRANTVKIWVAAITGGLALLGVIVQALTAG